ncbi:MAG TPA: hypothetical protein PKV95_05970 [Anaerolineaceae bacterium]|jgi:hypothetical protein|nr:hypothetical protein [Longilinea sp.]HNZ00856.1 hypothetical protein [Anaerolineaceae bacterium]HOH19329.1 hypothetical protein [Anaerolineaceae bacterium]HOU42894.1 hypothetical protein [Anaerolineaceae bacterium]HPA34004.1 hypothetical protein [Anaerolineaceae bacterium]
MNQGETTEPREEKRTETRQPHIDRSKIKPAFWMVSSILSLVVNIILIAVILLLGRELFTLKNILSANLIEPLYTNFKLMDEAHIRMTIPVSTTVPAVFELPLETDTSVTLTTDTVITNAEVSVYTGGLMIQNARTDIVLPAGAVLPVHLSLTVPVNQSIPVELNVDVDIPLEETELHEPFVGLQQVVEPYYNLLSPGPSSWQEAICGKTPGKFCQFFIR